MTPPAYAGLLVAGGVGANEALRQSLATAAEKQGVAVFYPDLQFCTDNGAMIALVGALRLQRAEGDAYSFTVRPRWALPSLPVTGPAIAPL